MNFNNYDDNQSEVVDITSSVNNNGKRKIPITAFNICFAQKIIRTTISVVVILVIVLSIAMFFGDRISIEGDVSSFRKYIALGGIVALLANIFIYIRCCWFLNGDIEIFTDTIERIRHLHFKRGSTVYYYSFTQLKRLYSYGYIIADDWHLFRHRGEQYILIKNKHRNQIAYAVSARRFYVPEKYQQLITDVSKIHIYPGRMMGIDFHES